MKITIEPTEEHQDVPYCTVVISVPTDDVDLTEAIELVGNALIAWGFDPGSIKEIFEAEAL